MLREILIDGSGYKVRGANIYLPPPPSTPCLPCHPPCHPPYPLPYHPPYHSPYHSPCPPPPTLPLPSTTHPAPPPYHPHYPHYTPTPTPHPPQVVASCALLLNAATKMLQCVLSVQGLASQGFHIYIYPSPPHVTPFCLYMHLESPRKVFIYIYPSPPYVTPPFCLYMHLSNPWFVLLSQATKLLPALLKSFHTRAYQQVLMAGQHPPANPPPLSPTP